MIASVFATQIYQAPLLRPQSALFKNLLREARWVQANDQAGKKWSAQHYPFGFTSYASMNRLHLTSPAFADLQTLLDRTVAKYWKALRFDASVKDIEITDLWMNSMFKGAAHSWHLHPHSVLSGTVYLQFPKGASALRFEDPRLSRMMLSPLVKPSAPAAQQRHIHRTAKPGDVILFESWLNHEVPTQRVQSPRISLSFNYGWKR